MKLLAVAAAVMALAACGGSSTYAGLSQSQADQAGMTALAKSNVTGTLLERHKMKNRYGGDAWEIVYQTSPGVTSCAFVWAENSTSVGYLLRAC